MFYSKKYNLLFIASPKTGTVSVHEALEKMDPTGSRRYIEINNMKISGMDLEQGIIGHARARELRKAIGPYNYDNLNTMAFVRNPYAKLVSSYFFNKKNKLSQAFINKGKKNKFNRSLRLFLSVLIAKVLPFEIWAFIYPYRSNLSYITDYDGQVIVKHIGRTESLNDDFHKIMDQLEIQSEHILVGKKNTSSHNEHIQYFKSKWFKNKMYKKMKEDIDFYNNICEHLD